jgi:hypothetical protein
VFAAAIFSSTRCLLELAHLDDDAGTLIERGDELLVDRVDAAAQFRQSRLHVAFAGHALSPSAATRPQIRGRMPVTRRHPPREPTL